MNATKILTTAMSQRLVPTFLALMLVFVMKDTRVVGSRAAVCNLLADLYYIII